VPRRCRCSCGGSRRMCGEGKKGGHGRERERESVAVQNRAQTHMLTCERD
jgi:hypothetical protein